MDNGPGKTARPNQTKNQRSIHWPTAPVVPLQITTDDSAQYAAKSLVLTDSQEHDGRELPESDAREHAAEPAEVPAGRLPLPAAGGGRVPGRVTGGPRGSVVVPAGEGGRQVEHGVHERSLKYGTEFMGCIKK